MYNWRILSLTVTACLGGFLFGYDTGFIGGVTTLTTFQHDFGITPKTQAAMSGNVVSALQAGCFFGVIIMAFITDRIGRRLSLIMCGILFNIGAAFQTAAKGKIALFYVGRVISGLGVGASSMLTPTFIAEMAPKNIRGILLNMFGFALFLSIMIAYWVVYACSQRLAGTNQWRVPVALQLIPGTALTLGMIVLKESPRWLIKKGKSQLALENLRYVRQQDTSEEEILTEFEEIVTGVETELAVTANRKFTEIFMPGNRIRMFIAIAIMICQQLSGTISFTYYAPVFFKFVGITGNSAGLFATGVYGVVKSVASFVYALWGIERFGRRASLIWGGAMMGTVLLIVAIIYATLPPQVGSDSVSPASYAMIVMIYLFAVAYACSWGPGPWSYVSEIFPTRLREYGVTAASATQWAFNYMFSKVIPLGINSLKWKLFLMFAIFNFGNVAFTYFFIKETKGLSLEEMEELFGSEMAVPHGKADDPEEEDDDDIRKRRETVHIESV